MSSKWFSVVGNSRCLKRVNWVIASLSSGMEFHYGNTWIAFAFFPSIRWRVEAGGGTEIRNTDLSNKKRFYYRNKSRAARGMQMARFLSHVFPRLMSDCEQSECTYTIALSWKIDANQPIGLPSISLTTVRTRVNRPARVTLITSTSSSKFVIYRRLNVNRNWATFVIQIN